MPLRLITGRANAGKTGIAYARVRRALREGASGVLLLPNRADVIRASDELGREFAIGARVSTFERYLANTWSEHGDGRAIVSPVQRRVLLASAASALGRPPGGLARLAERCVAALADQTGLGWRASVPTLTGPGAPLGQLISTYASALEREGLLEPAEATRLLAERSCSAEVVVAHRFTDFTRSQEAFLTGAARGGAEVIVTLTWEEGFAPTEALTALAQRLSAVGEVESVRPEEDFGTASELKEIEARLFVSPISLNVKGAVRLSTAEGVEAEAARIAEEVQRLVMEENVTPEHVAVLFRSPERHAGVVREAFRRAGIPADFDVSTPFGSTGFGRAFLGLLRYACTGDRSALLAFLRSQFSGVAPAEHALLEAGWRLHDIRTPKRLLKDVERVSEVSSDFVANAVLYARGPIDCDCALGWQALARRMLTQGYGRGSGVLSADSAPDALSLGTLSRLLGEIQGLAGGRVTAAELAALLAEQALPSADVERPGHVQVTGVTRARARRFEAIVLGGLSADEFPASAPEDMLPGGAVAHVLEAFGGSSESRLGTPYERLLFYQTITRARRFLVLSACTSDADGDALQVSPLLEEVLDFYRAEKKLTLTHTHRTLAQVPGEAKWANARELELANAYAGKHDSPRLRAASRRSFGRRTGLALDENLGRLAARSVFSASEIEVYLSCPYRWFYERAVRPERLDRVFGVAEQGTFAHGLLAAFYKAFLDETGQARVTLETERVADALVLRVFDQAVAAEGPLSTPGELARREALRWVRRIVRDDADFLPGFSPVIHEWDFTAEPVEMGSYLLAGRVDRIDLDKDGHAVVSDYKRSSSTKAADVLKYGKVQIPLYLGAVESRLGHRAVGGVYRSLRSRQNRGMVRADIVGGPYLTKNDLLGEEEFSALYIEALELAASAVAGIRAGEVPCAPRTADACRLCAASRVCEGEAR